MKDYTVIFGYIVSVVNIFMIVFAFLILRRAFCKLDSNVKMPDYKIKDHLFKLLGWSAFMVATLVASYRIADGLIFNSVSPLSMTKLKEVLMDRMWYLIFAITMYRPRFLERIVFGKEKPPKT